MEVMPEEMLKPREKAMRLGIESLSDTELVALLVETGTREEDVMTLSHRLLLEKGGLKGLFSVDQYALGFKGIGVAKLHRLLAVREIMRRLPLTGDQRILDEEMAFQLTRPAFLGLMREKAIVLYLSREKTVIRREEYSLYNDTMVEIPLSRIAMTARYCQARFVLVMHNHPSQDVSPSDSDITLTSQLQEMLLSVSVILLDSIIVSDKEHYSFRRAGERPFGIRGKEKHSSGAISDRKE